MDDKVCAISAITALLLGPVDVGNTIIAKEGKIEMILAMAASENVLHQRVIKFFIFFTMF